MSDTTSAPATDAAPTVVDPSAAPAPVADTTAADTVVTQSALTDVETTPEPKLDADGKPVPEPKLDADGKPIEEKPPEEQKPVEYTDFELPDGLDKDNPTLVTFKEEAAKLGLTQDQAQALVKSVGEQIGAQQRAGMDAWVKTNNDWQAEIKADPEIGGDAYEPMRVTVAKVMDDFAGPATRGPSVTVDGKTLPGPILNADRKALNEALLLTGAGNNPAIVKFIARMAGALNEGGHVAGNPARTPASAADLLYPNQGKPSGAA